MTAIRTFFSQITTSLSDFWKRAGNTCPPTPSSYMRVCNFDPSYFVMIVVYNCSNYFHWLPETWNYFDLNARILLPFIWFLFSFRLFWFFQFSFFAFSHGLAISFQFEFHKKCQKWKCQIILFDISIVSLDIAKVDHVSKI